MSPQFATGTRPPLGRAFDTPETKRRYVQTLFTTIADRYDLITRLLSFGRDAKWKRRLLALAEVRPGDRVWDLACGTGDLAFGASNAGGAVIGLDLAARMIERAREREQRDPRDGRVNWIVGDMTKLPAVPGSVDVITTGYGLRNVPDLGAALNEIHCTLRPGGRFCSLDFDRPESRWLRAIYLAYLDVVGGCLGWVLHRNPDTYRYIPASIRRYPGSRAVAEMMRAIGFTEVRHIPVLGGLMAIHVARR